MTHRLVLPESVQLAVASPFRLGEVDVDPPTRRLWRGDREQLLEPRVMQVLVALALAEGAVVSRDELIARCWDGRIVGEDAIHRAISRIRQIERGIGSGSFRLETIPRVGYRLRESAAGANRSALPEQAVSGEGRSAGSISRRTVLTWASLVGGGSAVVTASAFLLGPRRHRPPATALELYRRGVGTQRIGTPDQARQAVAFFKQAVELDPDYSDAWGALALAYRHLLEGFGQAEKASLPGLIDSAAARALDLDPDNADALLARIIAPPFYRHWAQMEPQLRALTARFPGHWLAHAQLGLLLQDVGRLEEGLEELRTTIRIDPFLPIANALLARGLSCAGRPEDAEAVLTAALNRWPAHPVLWFVRFNFLLYNGRPEAAASHVQNPDHRPPTVSTSDIADLVTVADAVATGDTRKTDGAAGILTRMLAEDPSAASSYAPMLVALNRPDLAFDALDRYYFGARLATPPVPAPGAYDRRYGLPLFSPPFRALRDDPRRLSLLNRTGIADYWRATGSRPDRQWAV